MPSCASPRTAAIGIRRATGSPTSSPSRCAAPLAEFCAAYAWKGCKLAASGDFETITFSDDPTRQPGFLIKATEVELLSPRRAEDATAAEQNQGECEAA